MIEYSDYRKSIFYTKTQKVSKYTYLASYFMLQLVSMCLDYVIFFDA